MNIIDQLLAERPVVTDGAWGTQLQARGLVPGGFPDLWNLRFPDRVRQVASDYVAAGSRVILTNTFGANYYRLREVNMHRQVREINCAGVWISQDAAGEKASVFASMGPSGKMLVSGDVTFDDLRRCFSSQAEAFAEAGADAVVIETMSELQEARAAVVAVREAGLPAIACMAFDSGKFLDRTMMGTSPEQVAAELTEAGASVIGANCGHGIKTAVNICARLGASTRLPIWIKPNAGLPVLHNGRIEYQTSAEEYARHIPALIDAGADFIGACCGSNPEFIHDVRQTIGYWKAATPCV